MKLKLLTFLAVSAALTLVPSAAPAQRPPPTPDQRLDRLERQIDQIQRQAFPKGRPADTAGFADDPAATQSSVLSLDQRLAALERQMADLLRLSEENGNRLQTLTAGAAQLKADQEHRITALEQRLTQPASVPVDATVATSPSSATTVAPKPPPLRTPSKSATTIKSDTVTPTSALSPLGDPGEDAYTAGFHQWEAGQFDQAIGSLKAFATAYPKHRRVSYANNLIGRSLLDKGDARGAAAALLANYRGNPNGERAQDSLYYLGQALMKLGQPGQSCKVYAELDAVYGVKIRPDVKKLETEGKSQAQCT